jgi:hypothetical protein
MYNVDHGMFHECGAIGTMRNGREDCNIEENPPQVRSVHHTSHMTWSGIKRGPPRMSVTNRRGC